MIGILGGTGLYRMESLEVRERRSVSTPFGEPSAPLVVGRLAGRDVVFLARHGEQHERIPSEVNFRANIWALKDVGVETLIGVSAVGSLREEIRPGDLALPSQYLDCTKGVRAGTFFGGGVVAHVSTAEPTCRVTAAQIAAIASEQGASIHADATYACVEGPRLGTRAESGMLRGAGADLVGMTNVPEAYLACEAQLCYCTIALVTDYDCWMDDPARHVDATSALALFRDNLARVQQLLVTVVGRHESGASCPCRKRLRDALVTPRDRLDESQRALIELLSR